MKWIPLLLILSLTACSGGGALAPVGSYRSPSERTYTKSSTTPSVYKVQRGDTLYSISWRFGKDYKDVARLNGIRPPYTIFVGQKLRLKGSIKPSPTTSKQTNTTSSKKTTTASSTSTKKTTTVKPATSNSDTTTYTGSRNLEWRWPTRGKVISTYSSSSPGRKGIDISGKQGQSVVAAASGKVVYSGNGLPRYGNLLIIKHNDVYLSAYAHNHTLLVKEGAIVKGGQKIATLGRTGTQRDQLHFEIRRNGKPVDPMRFLPK